MDFNTAAEARIKPSNWNILTNNGTNITAVNNVTGESFSGTAVAFNAMLRNGAVNTIEAHVPFLSSAVPIVIGASGTVATDGTLTLDVALPAVYSGAWVFLPAGAVVDGLAGFYYVVFASTTVGQVFTAFNDAADAFVPHLYTGALAAALVAAVGSNAPYVQTVTAQNLLRAVIPANAMSPNAVLKIAAKFSFSNDINTKTTTLTFGGQTLVTSANTSVDAAQKEARLQARGVVNRQVTYEVGSAALPVYTSVDTTNDVVVSITGQSGNVASFCVLESVEMTIG